MMFRLKNSNFSENWDLLPWVQKNLLPSEIKESACEREGELKIKFEKERMRATEREMENFIIKKKNWIEKKTREGEEQ
jgi:predicted metal-dependent hydrolase